MDTPPLNSGALQEFLLDAQVLLTQSQECLHHLELIDNDPDACQCLHSALETLARRANDLRLVEVAHYAAGLQLLLAPACHQQRLLPEALPAVEACLTLLAWQLELVDVHTGRLNLDASEQTDLLTDLASVLGQPLPNACSACRTEGNLCAHPLPYPSNTSFPGAPNRPH
ncbi:MULTISPECIES: histidine kinase [Pseudomonas]|uniref:histidine kinase n=1 Tax=Pseudomonas TaxID=286 RepID=UPI0018ABDBAA|nr:MULTISPECIES: histidine kinase [Pseudomonas]MBF8746330.1 histidine kinase [Pseudomonas monteilii]MCT8167137.1 histidine kinase [Pseudomonas sp. HD6422]MCT8185836.1 histidine kinase [Pseudomonas sp. HD6421]